MKFNNYLTKPYKKIRKIMFCTIMKVRIIGFFELILDKFERRCTDKSISLNMKNNQVYKK